jgi:shikimate kinase
MTILLLGLLGSGKSTVGTILANETGSTFVEMDHLIVSGLHMPPESIPEHLWKEYQLELSKDLSVQHNIIVAGSGNIVDNDLNILYFRVNNPSVKVVYLQTHPKTLCERISDPSARAKEEKILQDLLDQRAPLYLKYADCIIDTDHSTPRDVALKILSCCQ